MNSESTRNQTSQQYFELRNELNRANRTENLKSELEFEIRESEGEYFIIIKSTGAEHGLRLATYKKLRKRWDLFDNEKYSDLYKYLFLKIKLLNTTDFEKVNAQLTSWILGLWVI